MGIPPKALVPAVINIHEDNIVARHTEEGRPGRVVELSIAGQTGRGEPTLEDTVCTHLDPDLLA
jgi:hypothetical protein